MDAFSLQVRFHLRTDSDDDNTPVLWAYSRPQVQPQLGLTFRIAKIAQYALLQAPSGVAAAKVVQEVILGAPSGIGMAKAVQYAILVSAPVGPAFGGAPEILRRVYATHRNDVPDDDYTPAWRIAKFGARDLQSALFSAPPTPPIVNSWPLNIPYSTGELLDSRADVDFAPPSLLRFVMNSAYRSALLAFIVAEAVPLARPDPYLATWMARRHQWDIDTTGMRLSAAHKQAGRTRTPLRGSRSIQVG